MKNITYLPVTQEDLSIVQELRPQGWGDITISFQFYMRTPYCYPIKAILEGKVVGIGAAILFPNTSWLAHIIVNEQFRNQGIGAAIVTELLKIVEKNKIPTCLLFATELGFPVYKKLGFKEVCDYTFFERAETLKYDSFSENIIPCKTIHYAEIQDLDKTVAGEDRWVLLSTYIQNAFVYLNEKDKVEGYYLPDWGEGLIVANTPEAGIELLKIKCSKSTTIVVPNPNTNAINFLLENGYQPLRRRGIRMVWGKETGFQGDKVFSRVAGKLG